MRSGYIIIVCCLGLLAMYACQPKEKSKKTEEQTETVQDTNQLIIRELSEKINRSPRQAQLYYQRARKYFSMNKKLLALKDMQKATELNSQNPMYFNFLGKIYFELTDVEKAIQAYEKSLSINPESEIPYLELGRIYLYMAKPVECIENINNALRINKYNAEAYALKASYYLQMKDTARAISNLVTSLDVNPDYLDSYIDLGYLYALKKDPRAEIYYKNALKLSPGNIQVMYNLGKFYQDMDSISKAEAMYRNILALVPSHKSASYNLAYLMFLKGEYNEAIKYFSKAIEANHLYAEAWLGRALSYEKLGQAENAIENYRQALKLDSTMVEAREALERLEN